MIYLDSNIFVIAANPEDNRHADAIQVLEQMEQGKLSCCTSVLTVDEVVWAVNRIVGREEAENVWHALPKEPNLTLLSLDELDVVAARQFYGKLDPRDCLHAQSYRSSDAAILLTEDADFEQIDNVQAHTLSSFLSSYSAGQKSCD